METVLPSITVMSFAYRNGLPAVSADDRLYIFDCRTIRDPMWERFTEYTGQDEELRSHFETQQPMIDFISAVRDFVFFVQDQASSVGETRNVCIAFGCTNGRHRSVYCADKLSQLLRDRYVREIVCIHREQVVVQRE